jgi:hypothetical protein
MLLNILKLENKAKKKRREKKILKIASLNIYLFIFYLLYINNNFRSKYFLFIK